MARRRRSSGTPTSPAAKAAVVLVGASALAAAVSRRRLPAPPVAPAHIPPKASSTPRPQPLAPVPAPAQQLQDEPALAPPTATRPNRRMGAVVTAIALVVLGIGAGFIGVAVASQRRPPTPPTDVAAPTPVVAPAADVVAPGRAVEGWQPAREAPSAAASPTPSPEAASATRKPKPSTPAAPLTLRRSKPLTLDIPAIDVHSSVQHLGQAEDGSLEVPAPGERYNEAAWYRHSPAPGSLGPAILLGHVDSAADGPSVFFRLSELRRGARIRVTRADGSIAVFSVDSVRRYPKAEFPTKLVYRDIDHAGLRILTCGGAFDNASGHYLDNIVVFASLAGSR